MESSPSLTTTAANASGNYAISLGEASAASGTNAIAIGKNSSAAANAIAIGDGSVNQYNIVIGDGASNNASANGSLVIGTNANLNGNNSIGVGAALSINGDNAVGVGHVCAVDSNDSVAIGYGATAQAVQSVAIGSGASASVNQEEVAIGMGAQTTDFQAVAVGKGSRAGQEGSSLGYDAQASGAKANSIGWSTRASAARSSIIGFDDTNDVSNSMMFTDPVRQPFSYKTDSTKTADFTPEGDKYTRYHVVLNNTNAGVTAANPTGTIANGSIMRFTVYNAGTSDYTMGFGTDFKGIPALVPDTSGGNFNPTIVTSSGGIAVFEFTYVENYDGSTADGWICTFFNHSTWN